MHFAVSPGAGVLRPATQCPSPNQDERPEGAIPELIIIHGISLPPGEYGGPHIEELFTNKLDWQAHPYFGEIEGMQVSSHLLIRRDGSVIQFVPLGRRAWHSGLSCFRGRGCCNDFSIGIELEGTDDDPYEEAFGFTHPNGMGSPDTSATPPFLELTFVPEPATLALLAVGGLAVIRKRRK